MSMQEMLTSAREAITVRRVFGEPYERDGVTIIPVASVMGGGGGGSGRDAGGASGDGGGFGVRTRPVGAFVIRDGGVRWEPALDLNRIILGGQVLGLAAILVLPGLLRHRERRG